MPEPPATTRPATDPGPRLEALRAEGERAIAAAGSTAELEEARVRFLGRKAELTGVLRSIGSLPADRRGPVGKEANAVREELERRLAERTTELEHARARRPPGERPRSTSRSPATRRAQRGGCT